MTNKRISILETRCEQRKKLVLLINSTFGYEVVHEYDCFKKAFKGLCDNKPDVIIIGLETITGSELDNMASIRSITPEIPIIVLSEDCHPEDIFEILRAGIQGYLLFDEPPLKLLEAIGEVLQGGSPMSNCIAHTIVSSFHKNFNSPLSKREQMVLEQLTLGKSYTQIAQYLSISKETVRTHLRNIYWKMDVNSKAQAIEKAINEKII